MGGLSSGMNPLKSLAAVRSSVKKVTYDGQESVTGVSTGHYTVTVSTASLLKAMHGPMSSMAGGLPGGAAKVPSTISYDLWLDAQQQPRQLRFALSGERALVQLTKWGEPVHVQAPAPSQVVKHPSLGGLGTLGGGANSRQQGSVTS